MPPDARDPVTEYAELVVAGELPAPEILHDLVGEFMPTCKAVQHACLRHLHDLEHGHERGLWFDAAAARKACTFFPAVLRHTKAEWKDTPIVLELWQEFVIGCLMGWKRADGTRRFRNSYVEIPRKNAKSTMCAGLALLLTFFDGEGGAEGYTAATKRDQAKIVWGDAREMWRKAALLRKRLKHYKSTSTLIDTRTNSTLVPLAAEAKSLDGLNPHVVVIDELHRHPNAELVEVMDTATGARGQPLQIEITTAGHDRNSVCFKHHEHTLQVLDPDSDVEDDAWFGFIATIDEGDDWTDPVAWAKANPNLGVSVKVDDFAEKCNRAQAMPSSQPAFKQKRLDMWVSSLSRAIRMEDWAKCGGTIDREALKGRKCWGAFDLARVNDISSFALIFPPLEKGQSWELLVWHWVPEEDIELRSRDHGVPYRLWEDKGLLVATDGETTDYDFIEQQIFDLAKVYDIQQIGHDPTFAGELVNHLMDDGLDLVELRQGWVTFAGPTGEFLRLVKAGQLNHGGCPVLRWMAENLVVRTGPAGVTKPDKEKSREKIDGIVAAIMALGLAMLKPTKESVYEERGPRVA